MKKTKIRCAVVVLPLVGAGSAQAARTDYEFATQLLAKVAPATFYDSRERGNAVTKAHVALPPAPSYLPNTRAVADRRAALTERAQAMPALVALIDAETSNWMETALNEQRATDIGTQEPLAVAQKNDDESLAPPERGDPKGADRDKRETPKEQDDSIAPPQRNAGKPAKPDAKATPDDALAPPERGAGEQAPKTLPLSGSLRAGYWSSDRMLNDERDFGSGALWLKSSGSPAQWLSLYAEGWARSDNVFHGSNVKYRVREAYGDLTLGPVDLRLGRQIIVWGRADRINPTDNLTPRDFTLLVPEDDDNRYGVLAAKARYNWSDLSLTGVWLPEFQPDVIPLSTKPQAVTLAPGLVVNTTPEFAENAPHTRRSWALKLEQSGKAVDWSVSYYDGFDLFPDVSLRGFNVSSGVPAPIVQLDHNRIKVLGADAATTLGKYGLRAEAAYTRTEDREGKTLFVKNPFFYGVLGVERTFLESLNVNLQYFVRHVYDFEDPAAVADPALRFLSLTQAVINFQRDKTTQGMTVRVSNKWLHDTLEAELAGVWDYTRHGYVIRPKLIYAITDKWKATAGADFLRGPEDSVYGRLKDNSTVFFELSRYF